MNIFMPSSRTTILPYLFHHQLQFYLFSSFLCQTLQGKYTSNSLCFPLHLLKSNIHSHWLHWNLSPKASKVSYPSNSVLFLTLISLCSTQFWQKLSCIKSSFLFFTTDSYVPIPYLSSLLVATLSHGTSPNTVISQGLIHGFVFNLSCFLPYQFHPGSWLQVTPGCWSFLYICL